MEAIIDFYHIVVIFDLKYTGFALSERSVICIYNLEELESDHKLCIDIAGRLIRRDIVAHSEYTSIYPYPEGSLKKKLNC